MNKPLSAPPEFLSPVRSMGTLHPAPAPASDHAVTPEYVEYWRAVMMRKWSILALVLLVAAVAAIVVHQITPRYRSTALVLVESSKAKVVQVEDVYTGISANREYFQTQAEVLKSRDIALRVVRDLKLASHPEFDPRQRKRPVIETWVLENVPYADLLITPAPAAADQAAIEAAVVRSVAGRLTVEPVRLSQLVRVSFESSDPSLAALVANGLVEAYVQADISARMKMTSSAGSWINERLGELKGKLDASEKALQTYREREGMLDGKSMVLGGNARQLEELTQRLVEARVRRSEAEEAYNQVKAGEATNYESVPAVVRNIGVQRAKEAEADAERKVAEVSQRYGPDHPRHVAADSELTSARANSKRQVQNVISSILKEYNAARATEKTIEDSLNQSRGQIQNLNRKEIQLGVLEREAAANRQLYQTFLSRYKETNATGDAQQPNARLVEMAVPALLPVWPKRMQIVAVASALALIAGVAVALLLRALNNTVRTTDDVARMGLPFLAALPRVTGKNRSAPARELLEHPQGVYAECVRTAATGVLLSSIDTPRKTVLVTSSVPGEGKSTFSFNFAFQQARTKKVLLIEADMRRPSLGAVVNAPAEQRGLSECLVGSATLEESLIRINDSELHVLLAGQLPPNPLELLSAIRFRELLLTVEERYDLVVIDSAPLQVVSDALVLAPLCTGVVYIVKADSTPTPMVKQGVQRLETARVKLFGVVLNQQDFKKAERYYGEYSAYGRYGYSKGYVRSA